MKYVITESRLNTAIYNYFDTLFDVANINWSYPYEYDDETGEESEDTNRIEFYKGDFSDEDVVFRWTDCDYFREGSHARSICPTVNVEYAYEKVLNGYFSNFWQEPFKEWFKNNFELPIKTVETWDD